VNEHANRPLHGEEVRGVLHRVVQFVETSIGGVAVQDHRWVLTRDLGSSRAACFSMSTVVLS